MNDKEFYELILCKPNHLVVHEEARDRLREIVADPKKSKCCHAPTVEIKTQNIKFCFKCKRDLNEQMG